MASSGPAGQRVAQAAPGNAPNRAAANRRPVLFLLSSDDGLLIELGPLLGDRYRTRPIDSAEQLEAPADVAWALLIDATTRKDARAQAARFEQQFPLAPVLVICADGSAADWNAARSRGMVSAVVERGSIQSGAFSEALAAMDRQLTSDAFSTTMPGTTQRGAAASGGGAKRWAVLTAALLSAAAAAWFIVQHYSGATQHAANNVVAPASNPNAAPAALNKANAQPASAPAVAPAAAAPKRTLFELLSDARVAFREGKALLPRNDEAARGDSALELYTQALALDPQNEEARDGLHRLFAVARTRIQSDLSAGKLDEAGHLLAAFRNAGISPEELAAQESAIAAARPRWLVAQTHAAIASGDTATATHLMSQLAAGNSDRSVLADLHRQLEAATTHRSLAEMGARVRASIASGALLNPEPDSAQSRLQAMQQADRTDPLTLSAQRELQAALLARVRNASRAGQFEQAQQLLASAADFGNSSELGASRKQLQEDMQAAQGRAAAAATAARQAQQQPAATDTATAEFIRAKPLKPMSTSYPQQAYDAHIHGYVIVEFMLSPKGKAIDPHVVEADPPKTFDAAALEAVRSGRYDTSALADASTAQRARIRISFK
ncbi:MAG: energy transducer TonB [Steroidobacteraceae bacterium]